MKCLKEEKSYQKAEIEFFKSNFRVPSAFDKTGLKIIDNF
jgi:hypothetical protein